MAKADITFLGFVKTHPILCGVAVVISLGLAIAGWVAWGDFRHYQTELQQASGGVFEAAKDVREIDIQEHIAGFIYGQLLFSTFSFVVSLGALGFLAWTLRETRSMAIETRRMVSQSADDADEARRLSHAQYRAYVRAEEAHLQHRGGRWELRVQYKNDGQSPALHVHHRAVVKTRNVTATQPAEMTFASEGSYRSKRPVPPGASDTYTYPVSAYPDASATVRKGQAVTFVGDVIYRDIFGNWLRTEFEFYLDEMAAVAWSISPSNPVKLTWGRRGSGGVYDPIDFSNEPPPVQALIVKLDKEAAAQEQMQKVPT